MSKGRTGNAKAADIGKQIREKLIEPAAELSPVDEQLFGERVKNTVNLLTGNALDQIHDEATHSVEEEFVAYLSHNDAKPIIRVTKQENHLSSSRNIVNGIKKANRTAIERIRDALSFQSNKRSGEVHGLLSGDLDEGSLHKLQYDSEHIWSQKTLTRLPDVAVGILVDQSGSMASGYKIEQAREMCVVLAEAVKQVPGVHLHIYGHTANRGGGNSDLQLFEHYSSTGDSRNADLGQLGAISALSNNYDGYAIKETAKRLSLDPAKKKYLFIIADGLPHGTGYCGKEAEKHVKSVCSFVRTKLKISTYAFGVGVSSRGDIAQFTSQYGENNTVFISNVKQALPKIVRFLRHVLQKEKTLVDANTD
jgi:cobalamin biosynthesis protein CobT